MAAKKVWLGQIEGELPPGRPGVRIARICSVEECKRRMFGDPEWECDKHPGMTVDQTNNTYMGKTTASIVREPPPPKKAAAKKKAAKS